MPARPAPACQSKNVNAASPCLGYAQSVIQSPLSEAPGVVVDDPLARAVLHAAVAEGLVDGDPQIGDGFVRTILANPPQRGVLDSALEQLVVGGRIVLPFSIPPDWKGELFEKQILTGPPAAPASDLVAVESMPSSLMLGMLHARGHLWSERDLQERYQGFLRAYDEWTAIKGDKSFDFLELREFMDRLMGYEREDYSPEQRGAWKALQQQKNALQPVLDSIGTYRTILSSSLELGALSSVPVLESALPAFATATAFDAPSRTLLLRVACRELGRTPIATNLRRTIELAQTAEAVAMRARLDHWATALQSDPGAIDAAVARDVQEARAPLLRAKHFARAGAWLTWVAVPAALALPFAEAPVGTSAGIALAVVGGVILRNQQAIERMKRWAMFG